MLGVGATLLATRACAVRRAKADISPDAMVAALQALQADLRAAAANNSMSSAAVWQAVRSWDEVQVRCCSAGAATPESVHAVAPHQ